MLITALWGMASQNHVFQGFGWLVWPLVVALHLLMLRRLDGGMPQRWWPWVHAGGVWLLVLLAGNLLVFAIGKAQLWRTAWATVILLAAASCRAAGRWRSPGSRAARRAPASAGR